MRRCDSIAFATISFIIITWAIRSRFCCFTKMGLANAPWSGRLWFLGASTEWPGVEPADVEIGDIDALAAKYPDVATDLRAFQLGSGD